jgi:DNA-directed RNA polymerase subunit F
MYSTIQEEHINKLWMDYYYYFNHWLIFHTAKFRKLQNYQTELLIFIGSSIEEPLTSDEQEGLDTEGFELVNQIKIKEAKEKLSEVNRMIQIESGTFEELPNLNQEEEEYVTEFIKLPWEVLNTQIEQVSKMVCQTYNDAKQYSHNSSDEPNAKRVMNGMI